MRLYDMKTAKVKKTFSSLMKYSLLFMVFHIEMVFSQTTLNLFDLPLIGSREEPSNLILTMDDSGSMSLGNSDNVGTNDRNEVYYFSSHYNKMYYDPTTTYKPPIDHLGISEGDAQFNAAIRGYYAKSPSDQRTFDLSDDFFAVWRHRYNLSGSDDIVMVDVDISFFDPCNRAELCGSYQPVWDTITICGIFFCFDVPVFLGFQLVGNPAFYYQFNSGTGCNEDNPTHAEAESCYTRVEVTSQSASEQTNFANWFQYYATRMDANKSALLLGLENADPTLRVARARINENIIESGPVSSSLQNRLSTLDTTERENLYDWVRSIPTNGSTPLRRSVYSAGEFFKTDNPYYENPEDETGDILGCRSNIHLLITDGFYNGSFTQPSNYQPDEDGVTLPDDTVYNTAQNPIFPNASDTQSLSDLTFHYWATDLHSSDDPVNPYPESAQDDFFNPEVDPATWQHMRSYAISFGAEGTLEQDDATYQGLLDGTIQWPTTFTSNATTIDDLWHSAINGRGRFLSATDSNELVDAVEAMISSIPSNTGTNEAVGISGTLLESGSKLFLAKFDPKTWTGDIEAFEVSDGSKVDDPDADSNDCDAKSIGSKCSATPEWNAYKENEPSDLSPDSREILTFNRIGSGNKGNDRGDGIKFRWADLNTTTHQVYLRNGDSAAIGESRLDYIRGDASNEIENGGTFRTRLPYDEKSVTRVGAIVHSNPSFVGDGLRYRFPDDLESKAYTIPSRDPMLYVGANDGMLHAYDAETGQEQFAYVPYEVFENLHKFTDPSFSYYPFVDGFIDTQDAYFSGQWRTMLVGGLRTGGQGYYALDITSPQNVTENNAAASVIWEFSDEDDADMGYTFGKPVIVKSNLGTNGRWVVLLANGYNSNEADGHQGTGEAVLYVLAANNGNVLKKITLPGDTSKPNGLGAPIAVSDIDVNNFSTKEGSSTDNDRWTADYVYAGDLQGNLWKFDLSSKSKGDWKAIKMFETPGEQPISSRPSVGSFPTVGPDGSRESRIVYFGTGSYMSQSDLSSIDQQAFYAIVDRDECTSLTTACIDDNDLVEQTLQGDNTLSANPVPADGDGCKINLEPGVSGSGTTQISERVVNSSVVVDALVLFPTISPESSSCDSEVEGHIYAMNRYTCGAVGRPIFDTNGDGVITEGSGGDSSDSRLSTGENNQPILAASGAPDKFEAVVLTAKDNTQVSTSPTIGRVRWRQIK